MKLRLHFGVILATAVLLLQTPLPSAAQSAVNTSAQVGTATLGVRGFHSPNSSVIFTTEDGVFLASTTTDSKGYFSISDTLVNSTDLTYCFQAVDFKRVGVSESCITLPEPVTEDIIYTDIFLPPTIGISERQIDEGQDAIIFGYSMPEATVTVDIDGQPTPITPDATGYYTYIYEKVPSGVYSISSEAVLGTTDSLIPTNYVTLEALSLTQQITNTATSGAEKLKNLVTGNATTPTQLNNQMLFVILPVVITLVLLLVLGVVIYKLKPKPVMIVVASFKKIFKRKRPPASPPRSVKT